MREPGSGYIRQAVARMWVAVLERVLAAAEPPPVVMLLLAVVTLVLVPLMPMRAPSAYIGEAWDH